MEKKEIVISRSVGPTASSYIALACVGSLQFGYGISCMNCMEKTITTEFGWAPEQARSRLGSLASAVYIGAAVGAFVGGAICKYGRRLLNLIMHALFIGGGVLSACSFGFASLFAGRVLSGLSVGLATVASPMLISEISPLERRGSTGVFHQLFVTIGIFVGLVAGTPLTMEIALNKSLYFRGMFLLSSVLSLALFLVFLLWKREETPTYYISVGKYTEAKRLLRLVYQAEDVETQFSALTVRATGASGSKSFGLCSALKDRWYRWAVFVGVALSVGQQLCGINAFVSLSTKVFENSGISGNGLLFANLAMSLVNVVMTLPSIYIVEAFGRKPIYIIGNVGQAIALALVPFAILAGWTDMLPFVSVFAVVGFVVFFAIGYGPVLWVYLNEMFPPEISGPACGLCAAVNWISGILAVYFVGMFMDEENAFSFFAFFAAVSLGCAIFGWFIVKETKGRFNSDSPYLDGRVLDGATNPLTASREISAYV